MSAAEGEAVAAFLALRRRPEVVAVFLNPPAPKPATKFKSSWTITIGPKVWDSFFYALNNWTDKPFYIVKDMQDRYRITEPWKFSLKVEFDTQGELDRFNKYLDRVFDLIKS